MFTLSESLSALEIIKSSVGHFEGRLAMQTSLRPSSCVLMHMVNQIFPGIPIIFVDTGKHFSQTLALRDEYEERFGFNIQTVCSNVSFEDQREVYGKYLHLSEEQPGFRLCCELRKELPFIKCVRSGGFEAILSGLQKYEGGPREGLEISVFDARIEAYKIHPLLMWTREMTWGYIAEHSLPTNQLLREGFTSIGCECCTGKPTFDGDERSGRFPQFQTVGRYCGINQGEGGDGI